MSDKTSIKKSPLSAFLVILVLLAALIPFSYSLLLSFTDYHPASGLFSSQYFGLDNYRSIISHSLFYQLVQNSFFLSMLSLCVSLMVGLLLALLLSQIKNKHISATAAGLLLIPFFMPASIYYTMILHVASSEFFVNETTWPITYAIQNLIPDAALIAFSGTVFSLFFRMKLKSAAKGALYGSTLAACLFLFLAFSPSYEASLLTSSAAVRSVSETFDTVVFQTSLYQSTFSQAASFML